MADLDAGQGQLASWRDRTVHDTSGDKVGSVSDVYVDNDTGQPDWLAVSTGWFGSKVSFVPVQGSRMDGDDVVVAYDKDTIKDAPRIDPDGELSVDEEQALYEHYGRTYGQVAPARSSDMTDTSTTRRATNDMTDTATATTDDLKDVRRDDRTDRDASMLRSEEELSVDKTSREAGRARLRKWVDTEDVHLTVPVEREVARVVREPVHEGEPHGDEFTEGEQEVVLSEENVDVSKRVVAKERVGLEKETVTEQVPVDETVRKERVEVVGDDEVIADDRRGGADG